MDGGARGLASAFAGANPHVETLFNCDATRVVPAGGALAALLLHESVQPFQMIFRALPDPAIHFARKNRPVIMPIGAFTTPANLALALAEYRFRPYRFDGLIPGEGVPLEDRRLSLSIGNTVPISNNTQRGNVSAQIVPGPMPSPTATTFAGNANAGSVTDPAGSLQGSLATFDGEVPDPYATGTPATSSILGQQQMSFPPVNVEQFIMEADGAVLLPQSNDPTQGAERLPFTYYVREQTSVTLRQVAFSPVKIPINFFEGVLSGFLLDSRSMQALLDKVRPCANT